MLFHFDRFGFERHAASFQPITADLRGQVHLVTGANSGIGYATARALLGYGARVILACRDVERGTRAVERVRRETGGQAELLQLDVSSLSQIRSLKLDHVDVLVNNAGVLPDTRQRSPEGHELTLATNLLGPHLLTKILLERGLRRVVNVSSGGMYTQKLVVKELLDPPEPFDGVVQYARTKRAMVVMTEMWAKLRPEVHFSCMHPGWADTPAVRSSLPRFHAITRRFLRVSEQGADTVVWLAAGAPVPSGRFWFDRAEAGTVWLPWTREGEGERAALWTALEEHT